MTYQNYLKQGDELPTGSVEVRWKDADSTFDKEHDIKPRQMTLRFSNNELHTFNVNQQTNVLHTMDGTASVFKWISYFESEEFLKFKKNLSPTVKRELRVIRDRLIRDMKNN